MIAAMPRFDILARPDPVADFYARRPFIALGPNHPRDDNLRNVIIQSNLNTAEPRVATLGRVQHIEFSAWQNMKNLVRQMNRNGEMAAFIFFAIMGIAFAALNVSSFREFKAGIDLTKKRLAEGNWSVNVYEYGLLISSRPLARSDLIVQYIAGVVTTVVMSVLPTLFLAALVMSTYKAYKKIPKEFYTQPLLEAPSSGATLVQGGPIVDAISHAPLSLNQAKRPSNIVIGHYVGDIKSVIRKTLAQRSQNPEALPHPFEARPMTAEEGTKFLRDVAAVFCAEEDQVRDCWNVNVPEGMVQIALERNPGATYNKMHARLRRLSRNQKFLRLLPPEIVQSHFQNWPVLRSELIA